MADFDYYLQHIRFRLRYNSITDGVTNFYPIAFMRCFRGYWASAWAEKYRGSNWTIQGHFLMAWRMSRTYLHEGNR